MDYAKVAFYGFLVVIWKLWDGVENVYCKRTSTTYEVIKVFELKGLYLIIHTALFTENNW